MDPQVQASFIPKKSLDSSARSGGGGGHFGLFFLIALLVFVISVVAAGAAFLYQKYLQTALDSKSHSLQLSQSAYDPGSISDLITMDTRINQAESLLAKHVAATALFNFLSANTKVNVYFSDFSYVLNADGSAALTLDGQADSFSTVALQSDLFGSSKLLKDVVFSNIAVGDKGAGVSFSVAATVDPSLLLYGNELASGGTTDASQSSSTPSQ